MKGSSTHTIQKKAVRYNYVRFESVGGFHAFVDDEVKVLSTHNRPVLKSINEGTQKQIEQGTQWYGSPPPKSISELDQHTRFMGMHLADEVRAKIKKYLASYMRLLDSEQMPKPKISYNDRGLGMFSFDRASVGLFKATRINTLTPIDSTITQLNIELGKKQTRTTVKKVFAYLENKRTHLPSMRLYIMAGANAHVQGDELLYVGLACHELIDFLQARGVAVEVNVLLGTYFNHQISMAVIKLKSFEDSMDTNQLLLLTSDPRYFRYKGFKALIALSNHFKLAIDTGLGRLTESMGYEFVQVLNEKDTSRGFVFEQSYSLDSAAKEVKRIITTYNETNHQSN
ncbi:MAG: hypothetical protein ABJQ69_03700 [Ekhidna sp.]